MDRDKVIKGLELCLGSIDSAGCPEECPYYEACKKYENLVVFQPLMLKVFVLVMVWNVQILPQLRGEDGFGGMNRESTGSL